MDSKDLHARAQRVLRAMVARHKGVVSDDVRSVVGYYQSCLIASDRAARQLLEYAAACGEGEGVP